MMNFDYSKLNTDPCNFPTKRALVSQASKFMVAKDSNISRYLNLPMYLPIFILFVLQYTPKNELKFDD